jgi:hypothetical protein
MPCRYENAEAKKAKYGLRTKRVPALVQRERERRNFTRLMAIAVARFSFLFHLSSSPG